MIRNIHFGLQSDPHKYDNFYLNFKSRRERAKLLDGKEAEFYEKN